MFNPVSSESAQNRVLNSNELITLGKKLKANKSVPERYKFLFAITPNFIQFVNKAILKRLAVNWLQQTNYYIAKEILEHAGKPHSKKDIKRYINEQGFINSKRQFWKVAPSAPAAPSPSGKCQASEPLKTQTTLEAQDNPSTQVTTAAQDMLNTQVQASTQAPSTAQGIPNAQPPSAASTQIPTETQAILNIQAPAAASTQVATAQSTKKIGFKNYAASCWVATTLHFLNTDLNDFVQNVDYLRRKDDESESDFLARKRAAEITLNLLEKSRNGQKVSRKEMRDLQHAMSQVHFYGGACKNWLTMSEPDLGAFGYVLEIKDAPFAKSDGTPADWYYPYTHVFPCLGYTSPDNPKINPVGLALDAPLAYQNGVPFFPYTYSGSKADAPNIFQLKNSFSEELDLASPDGTQCIMRCSDGSTCRYELAACGIFGLHGNTDHYYALVKEKIQGLSVWVEYNDDEVTELTDAQALELISTKAHDLIYRKIEDSNI